MNGVHTYAFPGSDVPTRLECGLSLAVNGPMRPWADGDNRARLFRSLGIDPSSVAALSQIHSRIVRVAESAEPFAVKGSVMDDHPQGDGLLTANDAVVPTVTVADCMPLWLYDPVARWYGVLHSGWRGTGILRTAVELASDEWGAKPEHIRVIMGPHIRSCCYTVDEERADYFRRAFGPDCVRLDPDRSAVGDPRPWRLSLAEANRHLAGELGILEEHLRDTGECTSCNTLFGSNRREGADSFTRMVAWIRWR